LNPFNDLNPCDATAADAAAQLDEEVLGLLATAAPERGSGVRSVSVYRLKGRLNASATVGEFVDELVRRVYPEVILRALIRAYSGQNLINIH